MLYVYYIHKFEFSKFFINVFQIVKNHAAETAVCVNYQSVMYLFYSLRHVI